MQLIRFLRAIIALYPRPEVRGYKANEVKIKKGENCFSPFF